MFDRHAAPLHRSIVVPVAFTILGPHSALAGEVDLENAGCPDLPSADRFMSVHLLLDAEGNGRDCVISSEPKQFCERVHSFDEGFLCLGLTHNNRPDATSAETTNSQRVDRLVVDGEEVEESYGKTYLRKDLATGPSGETYDVVVEHEFFGKRYTLTVGVNAVPDGPVKFNSLRLTYDD